MSDGHEQQLLTLLRQNGAEIARLQQQITHLHRVAIGNNRYRWVRVVVKDLETNPRTQYKVHLWGVVYWLLNFPAVAALFFLAPTVWLKWGIFITLEYSIYANFATDYGAMSAAMAAYDEPPHPIPPPIPLDRNGA